MRNLLILLGLLIFVVNDLVAQDPPTCFRISLTDKNNSIYSVNDPAAYLSQRAIDKRTRFNIAITEEDFPVNTPYIQQIKAIDPNIVVLGTSKWMNTVIVYCPDTTKLSSIRALNCVSAILPVANYTTNTAEITVSEPTAWAETVVSNSLREEITPYDYGSGYDQIAFHNGHLLHNQGFRGDSMLIVVFDAGWEGVDTDVFFSSLFQNGQLSGTRDLIPGLHNVFEGHHHGTIVTSTMAGIQEGTLVGTAPEANYYFIRSENPYSEQLIEEDFWAMAAEIADSLGADVVNSSLGYTDFADFPQGNFTYADMNGTVSIASRAATKLASKGVVVCISAGNEGDNEWHYIGHPCDAENVLAVGAADIYGQIASFSSRGPSSDGRVKPDITSVGVNTVCMYPGDYLGYANGTSLACPVAAGLCACLWQALPNKTSTELMQIVREAGSCYTQPNDSAGYGIPDFFAAYTAHSHDAIPTYSVNTIEVYPNPCTDYLYIPNASTHITRIDFYNTAGVLVKSISVNADFLIKTDISEFAKGIYVGKVWRNDHSCQLFKMIKA